MTVSVEDEGADGFDIAVLSAPSRDVLYETGEFADEFYEELKGEFVDSTADNLAFRVGKILQFVNDFEDRDDIDQISDLIGQPIPSR